MGGNVRITSGNVSNIGTSVTTTDTSAVVYKNSPKGAIQATVVGTGTVTATVIIDCSNDGVNWCATPLGTITLSGTTSSSDGFVTDAPWKYVRRRVTAISGTGATVDVSIGY
ncbi:MAG: hypothetical protein ACXWJZ_01445 [Burkholderiaceae bacterium]